MANYRNPQATSRKIVHAFAQALLTQLGRQIHEVIRCSSATRGIAEENSDFDVAVIHQSDDFAAEDRLWSIAHDISLAFDTLIDPGGSAMIDNLGSGHVYLILRRHSKRGVLLDMRETASPRQQVVESCQT